MWMWKLVSYFSGVLLLICSYINKNQCIKDVYLSQTKPDFYKQLCVFYTNIYRYSLCFVIIHTLFLMILYFHTLFNNKIILFIGIIYVFFVSIIGIFLTYFYSKNYNILKEYQQYKWKK